MRLIAESKEAKESDSVEFCIIKLLPVSVDDPPLLIDIPAGVWYGLSATSLRIDQGPIVKPFHVFKVSGPRTISVKYLAGLSQDIQTQIGIYFTDDIDQLKEGLKVYLSTEGYIRMPTEGARYSFSQPIWTTQVIYAMDSATGAELRMETKFLRPSGFCPLFIVDQHLFEMAHLLADVSYIFDIRHAIMYNPSSSHSEETAMHIRMGPFVPPSGPQRRETRHVVNWVANHHILRAPPAIGYADGSYPFKGDSNLFLIWNLRPIVNMGSWCPILEITSAHDLLFAFYGYAIIPAVAGKIYTVGEN